VKIRERNEVVDLRELLDSKVLDNKQNLLSMFVGTKDLCAFPNYQDSIVRVKESKEILR